MTPERIEEILRALMEAALMGTIPDGDTGCVDDYERGRADALRDALAEIERQEKME